MGGATNERDCDVLIVGAGIAGLTAARSLRALGKNVLVVEKSRGVGGRAATRRWDGLPVDHGAQFFTARSAEFRAQVDDWLQRGVCFEWSRGLHRLGEGGLLAPGSDNFPRYACREGMTALGRDLLGEEGEFVLRETKIAKIEANSFGLQAQTEDGRTFRSRALVMTPPAPQSSELLRTAAPDASAFLSSIPMAPCLALVARYPRRDFPWRGIQSSEHNVVSWIGNDTSKRPDLHPGVSIVVIHASPRFSEQHFGATEDDIADSLLEAGSLLSGADVAKPIDFFLQRWRYALGSRDGTEPARLVKAPAPLVLAGDAIGGGKIEGAWLSGREAARLVSTT